MACAKKLVKKTKCYGKTCSFKETPQCKNKGFVKGSETL